MFKHITNNKQLLTILKQKYKWYDCHVVAIDQLTNIQPKIKQIIIINYQKSTQYGNHWVMILCDGNKYVEYMDSFALEPQKTTLEFMRSYVEKNIVLEMIMTTKCVQKITEKICGWYLLMYLKYRINDKKEAYEAINLITYDKTIEYGKQLSKKYLDY